MKNINFENLEILSPAGNPENFMAALNSGADAIYLGLDKFNARMKADNFTTENIRDYIKLAHTFGVKVYITLNTLLNDEDFDEMIILVKILTDAKADAFIVQDLGVGHILKTCFKGITLHASTQMGIHNLEGALVAEKLGFSRIVLSRETSLEDIKEIHNQTDLEIEYFIHGALCVAFSGNCYLSSIENNASGNEGKCLQLCRLPYKNSITNETKYYLSTRDLALLENLPKLIEAGVTSFKIEGRLKHSGYVGLCTNLYKSALSLIKNNNFDIKFIDESYKNLQTAFSRGDFNKNAYLHQNNENNIINSTFQNHIGIKIGIIKSVSPFKKSLYKITLKSNHMLSCGDGLKFIDKNNNQVASIGVGNVIKQNENEFIIFSNKKLEKGLNVYLTQDAILEQNLLNFEQKLPLILTISANICEKLKIEIKTNSHTFLYESNEILEAAKNNPLSRDDIKDQFSKLGNSIFKIIDISVDTNGVFAPKSLLNKLRREMLEFVQNQLILKNENKLAVEFLKDVYFCKKVQNIKVSTQNMLIFGDFNSNFDKNALNIIAPTNYKSLINDENVKFNNDVDMALFLPVITKFEDKNIINKIIENLQSSHKLFVNNIGGLYYKIFKNKDVIISPLLNIKNKFAILALNELGITNICASIEASSEFVNKYNLCGFSNGLFPLMTFAHCPYKAVNENTCNNCSFNDNLTYQSPNKQSYKISRTTIHHCYFYLMKNFNRTNYNFSLKNYKHKLN